MRHLHFAELRDSWSQWLSVSLTFIVTNGLFASLVIYMESVKNSGLPTERIDSAASVASYNFVMAGLVGMIVIGSVTGLVINARRGSIARLGLVGSSPAQIVGTLMTQLAVVSLVSSILGDLVAIPGSRYWLGLFGKSMQVNPIEVTVPLSSLLWVNVVSAVVAMLGGLRLARKATKISPVEALRESQNDSKKRGWIMRSMRIAITLLLLFAIWWELGKPVRSGEDVFTAISAPMQWAFLTIPLGAMLIADLSPLTVELLTQAWTALIPADGTWFLSRSTVLGKRDRMARTVVPIMVTLALFLSFMSLFASLDATLATVGKKVDNPVDISRFVLLLGAPLIIAVAGGLSALLIMARQREAELALDGILGATPRQRVLVPILEGVILTTTATLDASLILGIMLAFLSKGLKSVVPNFQVAVAWGQFGGLVSIVMTVVCLCTVVPTLRSLRKPEPQVISRYIAA